MGEQNTILTWVVLALCLIYIDAQMPTPGTTCRMVDIGIIEVYNSDFGKMFEKLFLEEPVKTCPPQTDCMFYNVTQVHLGKSENLSPDALTKLQVKNFDIFVGDYSSAVMEYAQQINVPYLISSSMGDLKKEKERSQFTYEKNILNLMPFYAATAEAVTYYARTQGSKRVYLLYDVSYVTDAQLILENLLKLGSVTFIEQNILTSPLSPTEEGSNHLGFVSNQILRQKIDTVIFLLPQVLRWQSISLLISSSTNLAQKITWICGNSEPLLHMTDSQRSAMESLPVRVVTLEVGSPLSVGRYPDGGKRITALQSSAANDVLRSSFLKFSVKNLTWTALEEDLKQVVLPESSLGGKISFDELGIRKSYVIKIIDAMRLKQISEWGTEKSTVPFKNKTAMNPTKTLQVAVVLEKPFAFIASEKAVGNRRFSGMAIDIFSKIAEYIKEKHGILLDYRYTSTLNYGAFSDGIWSGAIGQLVNQTADVAIGGIQKTNYRSDAIDFTAGFASDSLAMLYKPTRNTESYLRLLFPFHYFVWLLIIACILIGGVWIFVLFKWDPDEIDVVPDKRFTLKKSLWYSLTTIFLFSDPFQPTMSSIKSFTTCIMMFAVVIFAMYMSRLCQLLLNVPAVVRIRSFESLQYQSTYEYGYVKDTETELLLTSAAQQKLSNLHIKIKNWNNVFDTFEAGLEVVVNARTVLIGSAYKLRFMAGNYKDCSISLVPTEIVSGDLAFGMRPQLPYRLIINEAMLHLRSTGQLQEITNYWNIRSNSCNLSGESEVKALDLEDIAGPCFILVGGCILAILALVIKQIIYNYSNHNDSLNTSHRFKQGEVKHSMEGGTIQLKYISEANSIADLDDINDKKIGKNY